MLRIDDTIFSFDILEKKFKCNLSDCHGYCCRYGDAGAPLTDSEATLLDEIYPVIKSYLRPEGIKAIKKYGTSVVDTDREKLTPLINNIDCAYSVLKGGILQCGIQIAWSEGKISFQKPLSCHLFPVRITEFHGFKAVNYQELSICSGGRECGNKYGIYIYEFLKEPLIRAFGEKMYGELCLAAEQLRKKI